MNAADFKANVLCMSDRIYPLVLRMLANRADAEDAVQDIMLKLWKIRRKIDGHPNLVGLIMLTEKNHCLDVLRKKNQRIEELLTDIHLTESQNGLDNLEWKELTNHIQNILRGMPKQQCAAILLRDIDGYDYQEIASVLGLKIEHVRVLVSRARRRVAIELKKMHYYEN